MPQIDVSRDDLERWFKKGHERGATHMTIMTDTFERPPGQYPRYQIPGEEPEPVGAMQQKGTTYDLSKPFDVLFPAPRKPFFDCGCNLGQPCGCG